MLKFQDLHIGFYGKKKENILFKADELKFSEGEFIALIGPNGAGKTTLFDHMMGFVQPLAGNFVINDKNLSELSKTERVKALSYVPSKFYGINHLTVYELIAMGRTPYTNLLNKLGVEDVDVIEEVISTLGLKDMVKKNTVHLSDGERQIAMIAKALAQESEMMILDEPTAFLDYNNKRKVLGLLKDIAEEQQKLIFISSHDLELCFEYCNRIIGIDVEGGKLIDFKYPFDREDIIRQIFK